MGWLIDPQEQVVMVFWSDRPLAFLTGQSVLPVLPEITLVLTVEQVFAWLQLRQG
ncbi:MAG: hypothetical protein VKJ46_16075 [Leptolyngbyaceae bacterium]|nr:hypothetical protein [Leptolyngbyaceae bacterium]